MEIKYGDVVKMVRIEPSINAYRFYYLWLEQDLFGNVVLVRLWGRIGTRGRRNEEVFDTLEKAQQALEKEVDRRINKRGYWHQ